MNLIRQKITQFLPRDFILRRVLKNTGYISFSSMTSAVFASVQSIIVANLLGKSGLGLLALVLTFSTVINQLFSFRMGEFVVRYCSKDLSEGNNQHFGSVVKISAIVEGFTSIIAFGFMLLVAPLEAKNIANDIRSLYLFQIYGLTILTSLATETANGVLRVLNHFKEQALINLIQSTLTFSIIVLASIFHGKILSIISAYLVGKIIVGIGPMIWAAMMMKREVDPSWWKNPISIRSSVNEMVHFAISTNLTGTIKLLTTQSEAQWLGLLLNTEAVGIYEIALSIINLVTMPITPFNYSIYPEIARSVALKKWSQLRKLLNRTKYISMIWTTMASFVLIMFGKWIITITYKTQFLPAYYPLMILLVGFGISNIFFWNRSLLLSFGKANIPLYIMTATGCLKIGLAFYFVPRYGIIAEAVLLSAYLAISVLLSTVIGYKMIPKPEDEDIQTGGMLN